MTDHESVVSADFVAAHLEDPGVRVLEFDVSPAAYSAGHIPGASLLDAYADLRGADYLPVSRDELAALLSRNGVLPGTTVITYGYGAPLGLWLLKQFGHADVRMLEGARSLWADAGHEWSAEVPDFDPTGYRAPEEVVSLIATAADLRAAIEDPETQILDVRSELEFGGERFWPSGATADAGRAGHVPGAVNVPIGRLRADDESLKSPAELRAVFDAAGVTPDKPVIVYCTIANRASQAWFGLTELLGYPDVRVYYGSWVEWGKRDDTPVDAGPVG